MSEIEYTINIEDNEPWRHEHTNLADPTSQWLELYLPSKNDDREGVLVVCLPNGDTSIEVTGLEGDLSAECILTPDQIKLLAHWVNINHHAEIDNATTT